MEYSKDQEHIVETHLNNVMDLSQALLDPEPTALKAWVSSSQDIIVTQELNDYTKRMLCAYVFGIFNDFQTVEGDYFKADLAEFIRNESKLILSGHLYDFHTFFRDFLRATREHPEPFLDQFDINFLAQQAEYTWGLNIYTEQHASIYSSWKDHLGYVNQVIALLESSLRPS